MPAWLVDAISGITATVISSALILIAHRVDRFFRWLRDQADVIDALDRAGAQLASAAFSLADSAARIERSASRYESANRPR